MNAPTPYPWSDKYTKALHTGEHIGKTIIRLTSTARAILRLVFERLHNQFAGTSQTSRVEPNPR